jgi:hypothetical protein
MKKSKFAWMAILILLVLVLFILTAANPWQARLTVVNLTGDDVYLVLSDDSGIVYSNLKFPGDPTPPPTLAPTEGPKPTPGGKPIPTSTPFNQDLFRLDNTTIFTIERKVYQAQLTACGVVMEGSMDLTRNLHLTITDCFQMVQYDRDQYLGEPTFEKPNFFRAPGMADWRFRYFVTKTSPADYLDSLNKIPPD